MVRVSLKNTFLSFEEHEDDEEEDGDDPLARKSPSPKQAASPRSRSVDCAGVRTGGEGTDTEQIEKLNQLLCEKVLSSPRLSPLISPLRSPLPSSSVRSASPAQQGGGEASAPPPVQSSGPSAQELKQLQRRLEEVCQPRPPRRSSFGSQGSISSLEEMVDQSRTESRSHALSGLHQVWSSASVSTLASDCLMECGGGEFEGEGVEFDLTIEEVPGTCSEAFAQPVREQPSASPSQPSQVSPRQVSPRQVSPRQVSPRQQKQDEQQHNLFLPPSREQAGAQRSVPRGTPQQQPADRSMSPRDEMQRRSRPQSPRSSASPRSRCNTEDKMSHQVSGGSSGGGSGGSGTALAPGSPWKSRNWPKEHKEYRHGHVPKNLNLEETYKQGLDAAPTTLMIRNIPNHYTQRQLINELDELGFKGTFNFLYIPLDKGTMSNVGYAFVNFVEPEWAERCMSAFQNYRFKRHRKIAAISVAHIQGLEANLAHYENAAVNTAKLKQRRPVIVANIAQTLSSAIDAGGQSD